MRRLPRSLQQYSISTNQKDIWCLELAQLLLCWQIVGCCNKALTIGFFHISNQNCHKSKHCTEATYYLMYGNLAQAGLAAFDIFLIYVRMAVRMAVYVQAFMWRLSLCGPQYRNTNSLRNGNIYWHEIPLKLLTAEQCWWPVCVMRRWLQRGKWATATHNKEYGSSCRTVWVYSHSFNISQHYVAWQ